MLLLDLNYTKRIESSHFMLITKNRVIPRLLDKPRKLTFSFVVETVMGFHYR